MRYTDKAVHQAGNERSARMDDGCERDRNTLFDCGRAAQYGGRRKAIDYRELSGNGAFKNQLRTRQ
jgi:hypothetical protein